MASVNIQAQRVGRAFGVSNTVWESLEKVSKKNKEDYSSIISKALFGEVDPQIEIDDIRTNSFSRQPEFRYMYVLFPEHRCDQIGAQALLNQYDLNTYIAERIEEFCRIELGDTTPVRQNVTVTIRIRSDDLADLQKAAESEHTSVDKVIERRLAAHFRR